jgi:Endonuclease/Exonuclease/phosphatase family
MGSRLRRAACALGAIGLAAIAAPAASADDDRRGDPGDRGDHRHHGDRHHVGHGTVRYATFNASLNRYREGQLVEELADPSIRPAGDRQIRTVAEIIQRVRPDVLLVNEFDFDDDGPGGTSRAAKLFQDNYLSESQNGARPIRYRYRYTAPSNTGIPSGFDLDNDGRVVTTPGPGYGNDSFGFGEFPGQFGMTVYSKHPILERGVRTFQNFLWKDMPGARLPDNPATPQPQDWYSPEELAVFRLSSKSHWDVPIRVRGKVVHFLTSHPTPPVFDGAEDRNGTRNADEIRLWADYVTPGAGEYIYDDRGRRGGLKPGARFVIAGDQNSDPLDGDSIPGAIQQLLDNPRVNTTVTPSSPGGPEQSALQGGANTTHRSDPAFDTADFNDNPAPGNLRADYVLPDSGQRIKDAFVFWPRSDDPLFPLVGTFNASFFPDGNGFPSSDHRLVAVDVKAARAGGDHDDDDDDRDDEDDHRDDDDDRGDDD